MAGLIAGLIVMAVIFFAVDAFGQSLDPMWHPPELTRCPTNNLIYGMDEQDFMEMMAWYQQVKLLFDSSDMLDAPPIPPYLEWTKISTDDGKKWLALSFQQFDELKNWVRRILLYAKKMNDRYTFAAASTGDWHKDYDCACNTPKWIDGPCGVVKCTRKKY